LGIEVQSLKLLLLARQMGVDFSDTLTIGRQDLLADAGQLSAVFARFGEPLDQATAQRLAGQRFANAVLEHLGAERLGFMDISDFEGATVLHDLNRPLDPSLAERHSLVFDGGTLEHVFDCVTALKSYIALPKVGGHLIVAVPANNEMGHGFYQFSPELFFRTLTPENGYRLRGLFAVPMFADVDWLSVADPASVRGRVGHNAWRRPTYIFAIAQRTEAVEPFARTPQQSDYAAEWEQGPKVVPTQRPGVASRIKLALRGVLPDRPVELALQLRQAAAGPDPRRFTPFSPGRSPLP
jgi:hypothetical protein